MMKFGAMNFPVKPVLDELIKIHDLGFDYFELSLDPPCAHHSQILEIKTEIKSCLKSFAMELVCHLPTFVYTADLAPAIRRASLEEMLHSLEITSLLGAKKAVLHPSVISGLGRYSLMAARKLAMESLEIIVEKSNELNIELCFENMYPAYLFCFEPDHFKEIFKRHKELKLTLDTGHAHMNDPGGNRLRNFIKKWPDKIAHIHVSDNSGRYDEHLAVGEGNINFKQFFRNLNSAGYDGTCTLEIFTDHTSDLLKSREHIIEWLS